MTATWAIFFFLVPRSPDNRTKLDGRAKRVRDEIVRLAHRHPRDVRVAYRLAYSGATPAERVVIGPTTGTQDVRMVEPDVLEPGDPKALGHFLRWAHNHGCVGKRCAVFLWGHGFGPAGLFSIEDLELFGVYGSTSLPMATLPRVPGPMGIAIASSRAVARAAMPISSRFQVSVDRRTVTLTRDDGLRLVAPPRLIARDQGIFVISPGSFLRPTQPIIQASTPLTTAVSLASGLKTLATLRGRPADFVLFQCCWVNGLEFAHQLRGEARAAIGSQTLVPIQPSPWPYERLFKAMKGASTLTDASLKRLAGRLVNILGQWHTRQGQRRPITALNTRDTSVARAFADLVRALKLTTPAGQVLNLEHLYSNAPRRDRKNGLYRTENSGLIDVLRLCEDLQQPNRDPAVVAAARKLEKATTNKLILAHHTPDEKLYRGATVFYHPSQTTIDWLDQPTFIGNPHIEWLLKNEYSYLSFSRESKWSTFAFEMDGLTV